MDERTLLRMSLLSSVMGLVALFLISSFGSIDAVDIGKIDGAKPLAIKAYGMVETVRSVGSSQVMVISQPSSIEVFVSTPTAVQRGDAVEVIGRSEEYQGESQIVAERIRVLRVAADEMDDS
jgi:DNA/RNA endonuclease YhcR with UshA esterase domain